MSGNGITLCVTSCGRPDLLRRSLDSLLAHNEFEAKWLIEDADNREVAGYLESIGWGDGVILNAERLGQMRSIDRLYEQVRTPLIFHCEDDWLFEPSELLADCKKILNAEPKASCVCVRKISDLPPAIRPHLEHREIDGIRYVMVPVDAHPEWFGFTFNPGLSRIDFWRKYGPFAQAGSEMRLSIRAKRDGLSCAFLDPGACHHIGGEAHVADPFQPARPKGFLPRLLRSIKKRLARIARRFGADV